MATRRPVLPDADDAALDPASDNRIEIVLPLKPENAARGSDLARVQGGLIPSLNRFCDPGFIARFTIVAPRADLAALEPLAAISDIPLTLVAEEDLLPGLPPPIPRRGWYIQQLLKIAYAQTCRTPFYLTLDADCFLIDMLDERVLLEGRAPAHQEPAAAHQGWWATTAQVMHARHSALDTDAPVLGVTPAFLHAGAMRGAIETLAGLGAAQGQDWCGYLAAHTTDTNDTWTEYSLYWTHLLSQSEQGQGPAALHYPRQTYVFCTALHQAATRLRPGWGQAALFGIVQSVNVAAEAHAQFIDAMLAETEAADGRRALGLHGGYHYVDPAAIRALLAKGSDLIWPVSFGGVEADSIARALGIARDGRHARLVERCPCPLPECYRPGFRALYLFDDPVQAVMRQLAAPDRTCISRNNNINFAPPLFAGLTLADYVQSGQDLLNLVDHFANWTDPAGPLGSPDYPVLLLRTSAIPRHLGALGAFLGLSDAARASLRENPPTPPPPAENPEAGALRPRLAHMYAALTARIDAFPDAALWDHRARTLRPLAPD